MNTAVDVAIIIKEKKGNMREEGEIHKCFYLHLYEQNMLFARLSEKGTYIEG